MKTDAFESQWNPQNGSEIEALRSRYSTRDGSFSEGSYPARQAGQIEQVYNQGVAVLGSLNEDESVPVPSFFDMDKTDMVAHLVEHHGLDRAADKAMSIHTGTKATKEELIAEHNKQHAALDNPMSEFHPQRYPTNVVAAGGTVKFYIGVTPVPPVKHGHQESALAGASQQVRNNEPAGKKPLSAAEAGVLKELVNNDFAGLSQQITSFAADALSQQTDEINAEWDEKEKELPDYAGEATKALRKHNAKLQALREKYNADVQALNDAYADGFKEVVTKAEKDTVALNEATEVYVDTDGQKKNRPVFHATVGGRINALKEAAEANKKYLDRALLELEGQRLQAQRQVLVSRVNPEGARILDTIPDAKTAMLNAQRTSTSPLSEITSGS